MADSEIEGSQGVGRSRALSEHLLCARLCNWHYTHHLIYSIYCYSKLFAIFFSLVQMRKSRWIPRQWVAEAGLRSASPPPAPQNKLPVGGEQHSPLPSVGFQRQGSSLQATAVRECCTEEVALELDLEGWGEMLQESKRGKVSQEETVWEKHREKCFRRMTVPVAENILCDTTLPSQPNLPAPWPRTLAASNSDYPLCLHVPPPFTWQALPSPLLPGEVFPGLPEFCQIPPAMCSHSLSPRPDAISLDSEHPEFFLFN